MIRVPSFVSRQPEGFVSGLPAVRTALAAVVAKEVSLVRPAPASGIGRVDSIGVLGADLLIRVVVLGIQRPSGAVVRHVAALFALGRFGVAFVQKSEVDNVAVIVAQGVEVELAVVVESHNDANQKIVRSHVGKAKGLAAVQRLVISEDVAESAVHAALAEELHRAPELEAVAGLAAIEAVDLLFGLVGSRNCSSRDHGTRADRRRRLCRSQD